MSPTLLEFAVMIILIVVAWQIGLAIAPSVIRLIASLKRDIDKAADEALTEADPENYHYTHKENHHNGTHH